MVGCLSLFFSSVAGWGGPDLRSLDQTETLRYSCCKACHFAVAHGNSVKYSALHQTVLLTILFSGQHPVVTPADSLSMRCLAVRSNL